jgi:hypothetical protein
MNVGTGNEAAQFYFWEYINRIFGTVQSAVSAPSLSLHIKKISVTRNTLLPPPST